MLVTLFTQWLIPSPTVCSNASARLNMRTYETNKTLSRGIRDTHKPDSTDTFAILIFVIGFVFHSDYYKSLVFGATATFAGPLAAYICFINLHRPIQIVTIWSNHGSPQPVKPVPSRMITSKIKYSLEPRALAPYFWDVICHIASNHNPNGFLLS